MKIDIGCGKNKKNGFLGLDIFNFEGVDIVINLNENKLPFPDKSVSHIYTSHFLEHIDQPVEFIKECSRVLSNEGILEIIVPHYTNPYTYNPFHKTYWNCFSLNQNYIDYYISKELLMKKVTLRFAGYPFSNVFNYLFNRHIRLYEWIAASHIRAQDVKFILEKHASRDAVATL